MTKPKPLPEIVRCACGSKSALINNGSDYGGGCTASAYWVNCSNIENCAYSGPARRTERGAINIHNAIMEAYHASRK